MGENRHQILKRAMKLDLFKLPWPAARRNMFALLPIISKLFKRRILRARSDGFHRKFSAARVAGTRRLPSRKLRESLGPKVTAGGSAVVQCTQEVTIFIRVAGRNLIPLTIKLTDKIECAKDKILRSSGLPPEKYALSFFGKRLKDNVAFQEYGIRAFSEICIVEGLCGGMQRYQPLANPESPLRIAGNELEDEPRP